MVDEQTKKLAFQALKNEMDSYTLITAQTWEALLKISTCRSLKKQQMLYQAGATATSFSFIYRGLFRLFVIDKKGNEYTKIFFDEGKFPAPIADLLTGTKSRYTIEALEDSVVIEIDFQKFRGLLLEKEDLKLYQIYYFEKNWLLAKDAREVQLVQENATQRYKRFVRECPSLYKRLAQYHVASHLGITPTQLSRVRKTMN